MAFEQLTLKKIFLKKRQLDFFAPFLDSLTQMINLLTLSPFSFFMSPASWYVETGNRCGVLKSHRLSSPQSSKGSLTARKEFNCSKMKILWKPVFITVLYYKHRKKPARWSMKDLPALHYPVVPVRSPLGEKKNPCYLTEKGDRREFWHHGVT